jgi:hypothetical protein
MNTKPQPVAVNNVQHTALVQNTKTTAHTTVKPIDTATKKAVEFNPDVQPVMASVQQNQAPVKAVVPDKTIALTTITATDLTQASTAKPAIAALPLRVIKKDSLSAKSRPRIHSFGDLVNVLVAKVDKRKDKVIEFTADDDGESNITGVNLGIIKIKKGE